MTAQELKAAILDLAIRGKLVPQDLNDEPADRLLERINEVGSCVPRDRKSATRGRAGRATLPPIADDEKPFDLPKSWAWCRLGEICEVQLGKMLDRSKNTGVQCEYLANFNVQWGGFNLDKLNRTAFSTDELDKFSLCDGDVLMCEGGVPGRCAIWKNGKTEIKFQKAIHRLRSELLLPELILWYFVYVVGMAWFNNKLKGASIKHLPREVLVLLPIPLPPLAEQKRIVPRIEELMPWVERYAAAEEKRGKLDAALPGQLKQSILKAAFAGALVADGIGVEKTLDAVCAGVFTGNSLSDLEKRKFTRPDGLPFIGTKDIGFDQVIAYGNGIRIPTSEDGYRIAPKGATLLCVEGGSSGRKIGLLTEDVRFGNKLCAFVPGDDLDSRYLFLFLQSPQFLEQFAALQNGPRKGAGVSQIKGLLIPMLPLAKQKELVRRIDDFLSLIQKM